MAKFAAGGHEWSVSFNWGLLTRISKDIGIDLTKLLTDETTLGGFYFADLGKMVSALYMACEKQATGRNISPEQFAELLEPDVLDQALSAILEAVIEFFPRARGREGAKRALQKTLLTMERRMNEAIDDKASTLWPCV